MALQPELRTGFITPRSANFSTDVSTTPGNFDINSFIQSLLQQGQNAVKAVPTGHRSAATPQAPPANNSIPNPPPPAAMPVDRLQMQRENNIFKKSIVTPRHLGMSGEELTPQNPFTSGFFTPPGERAGLQGTMPTGDFGLLAHHSPQPFSSAFTDTSSDAQHPSIASQYGDASARVAGAPDTTPLGPPNPFAETFGPPAPYGPPDTLAPFGPPASMAPYGPPTPIDSTPRRMGIKPTPKPINFAGGFIG